MSFAKNICSSGEEGKAGSGLLVCSGNLAATSVLNNDFSNEVLGRLSIVILVIYFALKNTDAFVSKKIPCF